MAYFRFAKITQANVPKIIAACLVSILKKYLEIRERRNLNPARGQRLKLHTPWVISQLCTDQTCRASRALQTCCTYELHFKHQTRSPNRSNFGKSATFQIFTFENIANSNQRRAFWKNATTIFRIARLMQFFFFLSESSKQQHFSHRACTINFVKALREEQQFPFPTQQGLPPHYVCETSINQSIHVPGTS